VKKERECGIRTPFQTLVIAIDGKKVISQANCAVFERLAFNLMSLIV